MVDSDASEGRFVFTYHIRLENRGSASAQLLYRHWLIQEMGGEEQEVDGEGVVGRQPVLDPGGYHEYRSFCVLRSPVGSMEGHYTFRRTDGTLFRVPIPRFGLEAPFPPTAEA